MTGIVRKKEMRGGMSQINKGADLLLHVADTSGHGVIQAAEEKECMHLVLSQTKTY